MKGEPRPKQSVPAEIKNDLLGAIRSAFYGDATEKQWHQDKNFILREVVLWPASWLNSKGVTLPPARYKAIILDVLQGIKRHGSTEAVKFWPGYLKHCLQTHFRIHGEEYYDEAKALRAPLASILAKASQTPTVDPIRVLAEARRDLVQTSRKTRQKGKTASQMTLLQVAFLASAMALQTPKSCPEPLREAARLAEIAFELPQTSQIQAQDS